MARVLHILMLVGLITIGTAACKGSDESENTLKNPNSNYDPSANLPTNAQ